MAKFVLEDRSVRLIPHLVQKRRIELRADRDAGAVVIRDLDNGKEIGYIWLSNAMIRVSGEKIVDTLVLEDIGD